MRKSLAVSLLLLVSIVARAQTTAFSYQGSLTDAGSPANGSFQMQFKLFDAAGGGAQIGTTLTDVPVTITAGTFSLKLDFGASVFTGSDRWLEVSVRHNAGEGYITLSPREQIASSPYSLRTLSAGVADDSQKLGGIDAGEYLTTAGAGNSFIRNQTGLQASSNFNISGSGFFGESLGIGTTKPQSRLSVIGPGYGLTHSDGGVTLGTYITPTGGWLGTKSTHPLHFFTGDSFPQMTLSPTGNFGIGTETPGSAFEIWGSGLGRQQRITDFGSGNSLVLQGGFDNEMSINGFNFTTGLAKPLFLNTAGSSTILNPTAGNVGVGTTSPQFKFTVGGTGFGIGQSAGGVSLATFISSSGQGAFGTITGHPLNFLTDGLARMTLMNSTGYLGIGLGVPTSALEIRGTGLGSAQKITDSASGNTLVLQGGAGDNMKVTGFNYNTFQAVPLYLSIDGANTIINPNGGNVGIGTASPGNARLKVQGGNIFIGNPNSLVLTSQNGTCWFLTVSNSGALSTFSVTCP